MDRLLLKVKADFLLLTDLNIKQFILSKILCFIDMGDYIPVGLAKAEGVNNFIGMYQQIEFISFDELVLVHLFKSE